jgi:5-methylcytosine-specific restriction endonuclease McrA
VALSAKVRLACYRRDGFACRHCNRRAGLHPHHILHKGRGGEDTVDNLVTLCWKCHGAHHDGLLLVERVGDKIIFTRLRGWTP